MNDISVIIVSYNTCNDTLAAISSVYSTAGKQVEVIVVDNASSDDSLKHIKKKYPQVHVIEQSTNVGFARANNVGAKHAHGKYLFFLNSDAILNEHALEELVQVMESDSSVGIVSGQLINQDGSIQPQGGALPTVLNVFAWMFFLDDVPVLSSLFSPYQQRNTSLFTKYHETGWVGGTACMMRRDDFIRFGMWDEKIFMYGEDVELCMRIRAMGKNVVITPTAQILHKGGASSGGSTHALVGEYKGLLYIWKKHYPRWQLGIIKSILWCGAWLRIILFGILLGDTQRKQAYGEAISHLTMD